MTIAAKAATIAAVLAAQAEVKATVVVLLTATVLVGVVL